MDATFPRDGSIARDPHELGTAIRRLRRERGWTQAQLAEFASVSRPTIIRLERGEPVRLDSALQVIGFLGARLRVERR